MKTLLQLTDIHKAYGAQIILDGLSVAVCDHHKIGVIGRNGAGKTTLCRIIIGQESPDAGTVQKTKHFRLAYLEQHDPYALDETVLAFLERYTQKEPWQCAKLAAHFQLKNELLTTLIGTLPGGFRTRVKLAAMLLRDPNILILDEPTNFLDLKTLILLEEFLEDYRGAFLIVSHDREFLKKTCTETLEIESGACTLYPGTVDEYLIFKEEQKRLIDSHNKNVEAKRRQLQEFVDRFRAKATKASQARSVMKKIEKLKTIETGHALATVRLKIPQVEKENLTSFRADSLAIGYPDRRVADGITMEFNQGDHIAILGDNGQGKTTLMRTIAGDLPALGGSYKWGHGLRIGYYAQHVLQSLDMCDDVISHLERIAAPSVTHQEILDMAGSFLFKGDDVLKKVMVLSGGEKARLCLAGLLLSKNEILLLDEPTNHLDFETVEAFGMALKKFHGTVFFISHDRTFVNMLANRIVEVKDGTVLRYPGNYEEYVYSMERRVREELGTATPEDAAEGQAPAKKPRAKTPQQEDRALLRRLKAERVRVNAEARDLHERIERHRSDWNEIRKIFEHDSTAWSPERHARYEYLETSIKEDEDAWLALMEKADELTKKIDSFGAPDSVK